MDCRRVEPAPEAAAHWFVPGGMIWAATVGFVLLLVVAGRGGNDMSIPLEVVALCVLFLAMLAFGIPLALVCGFGVLFLPERWDARTRTRIALFNLTTVGLFWVLVQSLP